MTDSGKVLIASPVHPVLIDGLRALGYECITSEQIKQKEAYSLIKDCVGVITSTRLKLDKSLIDAAPGLNWIGRMGSGMEIIDVAYANQKGIACFSSPEGNSNAVAEHVLGMLLALIRRIVISQNEIRKGIWHRDENRGIELEGKSVGIIGFGHTGSALARKLLGFDVRILAYDKLASEGIPPQYVNCPDLDPIFEQADIVSFHVPFGKDTRHYFNEDFMARMRKPFILINTSRGSVADALALHKGLISGKVTGACLDVFEEEPLTGVVTPAKQIIAEIAELPNVILTPHIAGYTFEAVYKMSLVLLKKITGLDNR